MIDRRELLLLAENLGLQPQFVEKDYALGWLLAGIRANADLGDHWVFKGGTCLKKCYFETYRFSEDLDFTIIDEAHLDPAFFLSCRMALHDATNHGLSPARQQARSGIATGGPRPLFPDGDRASRCAENQIQLDRTGSLDKF